jgi:hypothetical protein
VAATMAPGLVDRYLARAGFDAQQTEDPLPPGRVDNLFEPAPGAAGARGRFDAEAKDRSLQLELSLRRRLVAGAAAAIGAVTGAAARSRPE